MPIIIKDYTWTQSESKVCINLPLKGTKSTNLDILNSLEFCKVSYPPFLFECWFYDKVKDEKAVAVVNNGIISLQFSKEEEKIWPSLFSPESDNKELFKKKREEAIVYVGQREAKIATEKAEARNENKKHALKEQMKLEDDERKRIEKVKEDERKKAAEEIEKFKDIHSKMIKEKVSSDKPEVVSEEEKIESINNKDIFSNGANDMNISNIEITEKKEEKIAPLRSSGTIQIKFTPRVFPTPSRESQDHQEKEWLQKQADARKLDEYAEELKDFTASEKNLDWLKDKASNLYKQENFASAIGVYNHAIKIFPKLPLLYSNRAACHYRIGNLIKCVEDCTRALDLLTPPVADNAMSRLKAHVRRGSAFAGLELYAEGLLDYDAALKIDPNNIEIREDAEKIRKLILGQQPHEEITNDNDCESCEMRD